MADSASEFESDTSSIDGSHSNKQLPPVTIERFNKRIDNLVTSNKILKIELDTYKIRCKNLQEENHKLRQTSVMIQVRAEQEEEYISNTLLKKIETLKREKEKLATNYEQEEEFLTNDLSRKLMKLRQEKTELEETLGKEQQYQVNRLMRKIVRLETETKSMQESLNQLRREKVELENALENEQESLVNRLWKRMDKLEAEKRMLQQKLDQPISQEKGIAMREQENMGELSDYVRKLKQDVTSLRDQLVTSQEQYAKKMATYAEDEKTIREQNLRLTRKLQMEVERREALCRHLSESESSLEMDDERHFNEMSKYSDSESRCMLSNSLNSRGHTSSSPIPMNLASERNSRPLSPSSSLNSGSFAISPITRANHPLNTPPKSMSGYFLHPTDKIAADKFTSPQLPPKPFESTNHQSSTNDA